MIRYEGDAIATIAADWNTLAEPAVQAGTRLPLEGDGLSVRVFRTGRAARIDDYASTVGPIGDFAREHQAISGVACPIMVHGRLWGTIIAIAHDDESLPPE